MRGKTAQYWMTYCQIFDLIHATQRAIKSKFIPLYSYALWLPIPIFITTNYHCYTRLISRFALHLFNIKQENQAIYQMLQNRGVSVDRTGNVFAEVGVDMTLEQTINVPAKNGL